MKYMNVKNIIISITALLTVVSAQVTYNVSGVVDLEDQTGSSADHSGVKVKFYNLPSMVAEDSTTSASTGAYSINISPGYYLVEWTKTDYVPWELGGLSLAANTILDPVTMIPGEVSEVSGTINTTTWTTGFVYYVTGDITVPAGQTLTINAGVRVKFSAGKGMLVNGKLLANGTSAAHVIFTSREPTPLPGDWANIELNGRDNVLTYVDYDYATDGIEGTNADHTTINYLTSNGTLSITARGIYFSNSDSLTLTNNIVTIGGDYAIYANEADYSNISNNTVYSPNYGIRASDCDYCSVNNNSIIASEQGIHVPYSYKININGNNLTGRLNWNGIYFYDSDSSTVMNNYIERTEKNQDGGGWKYLIDGNNSEGSTIKKDTMIYKINKNDDDGWNHSNMILRCEWSIVDSNYIDVELTAGSNFGIYDEQNSDITNNYIKIWSDAWSEQEFIRSNNSGTYVNKIENNHLIADRHNRESWDGIKAYSNTIVRNNTIEGNYLGWAINVYDDCIVENNTISGYIDNDVIVVEGDSTIIRNNTMNSTGHGTGIRIHGKVYIQIYNNDFFNSGSGMFLEAYSSEIYAYGNLFESNTGRGFYIHDQSSGSIYNNTLVSQSGDYGMYQTTQTNVPVFNNIFQGFNTGIRVDNTIGNLNLSNNLFWDISDLFEGTALPPLAGQMIDQNTNGAASDIYNNISFDPIFVQPDINNYALQSTSPAVNAGDASYTDPDGSVSDIGAFYYHIYVVMAHTPLGSTNNTATAYTVNATASSTTNAAVTANLSYSLNGGAATTLAMTAGTNNAFSADIPAQAMNTRVQYYLTGTDGTHTSTLPYNLTDGGYEFYINLFSNFSPISVTSGTDGNLSLSWSTPVPISGTLSEIKIYKNENANVQLTSANLLVEDLAATATDYTDSDVVEGHTYYYKVVGVLSDGSESLTGPETSGMSNASTIMRVQGVVQLSDASSDAPDHSGVKALFSAASPTAQSDSMETDITGAVDITLNNGLYNLYFSKDGYQTQYIGGVFMAANVALDTVFLVAGGQTTISGDISGTLAGDTLYYASGNLTVPSGQTLTIAAGAQLLFQGDYSLTANGTLLVNGTANNRVVFTSGNLVKSAGDWGGIIINKSGARVSYADIQYSTSTIYAANIDTFTINNCLINNSAVNADGIRIDDNLKYFTIRENTITANGRYGIHKVSGNSINDGNSSNTTGGAEIVGNTIYAYTGIRIYNTWNARVDSNTILLNDGGSQGINNEEAQFTRYTNNLIMPEDEWGWYHTGMQLRNNDNAIIRGNEIRNCKDEAFYLRQITNATISQNIVTRDWHLDHDDNHIAFQFSDGNEHGNYFSENIININNGAYGSYNDGQGYRRTYGFIGFDSHQSNSNNTFVNNKITVGIPYDDNDARYNSGFSNLGNNAVLEGNKVTAYNHCCDWGDEGSRERNYLVDGNYNEITSTNDTLIMSEYSGGIKAEELNMTGTVISNLNSSHHNIYKTIFVSSELDMDDVTITGTSNGVYFTGSSASITKTTMVPVSGFGVNATTNGATINIERMTLIGDGTGTGVDMEDGVNLNMNSSVVDGFTTGLEAVSVPNLYSNSFYNNSTHFSGNGIGTDLGAANYFNVNGDAADVYGNLFLDPLFEDRNAGDYRPTINSPLVDAGAAAEQDLDGTEPDIGRDFYNFGYAPMNLAMTNTQSGTVSISWDIVETDSITGYQPYYKEASDDTWLYDVTAATTEKNTTYSELTNNTLYDFAVKAEYNSGSTISNFSPVLQERPGVTTMTLSPTHLIVSQDVGGTATGDYTVSNPGSRTLHVTTDINIGLGVTAFTKQDYEDYTVEANQDRITDDVWITRKENRGLFNYASETGHNHGYSPVNTEWSWGPTTNGMSYVIWRELRWNNTINTSNHNTMYDNDHVVSLHLINDDLYFDVTWHDWTSNNNGGGFSYTRTHVDQDGNPLNAGDPEFAIIGPDSSITRSKEFSGATAGIYPSLIMVTSNDPDAPRDSIFTLNIVGPQASLPAVRFSPVDTTGDIFHYVVTQATIDGQALQTGDEIALFSGDLCVGAGMFNGTMPFLVQAFGADPPSQAGFADGDSITVKAWDFGESRVATMTAVRTGGSNTFSSGGFSAAELTGSIFYTHDIAIISGSFNLLSTYLYPQFPAASTFFGGIDGLMIVYEDNGAAYIPEYGINTIGNVDMVEGYHLYTAGGDQTLTVSGMTIDPANWSITLQPNQFNSMAFLHSGPMNAEAALADIADVIDIVQDDAGNAWIPELSVVMGNMAVGKGYQVFTTVDTAVAFTYAPYVAPSGKTLQPIEKPQPQFYTFRKTGMPYTIVLQAALVDEHTLEDGDEVAVFDDNYCVGAVVWDSKSINILTAWKGDEDLELPGYIPGHDMTFQIYKKRFKENVIVDASFPDETEGAFEGSSYSRVSLKGYPGLIPEEYALRQNYPNPFNPATTIRYDIASDAPVTMVIYNIIGQEVVRMLNNKVHAPGKYSIIWQGTNQYGKKVSAGVYLVHMYSSGFSETRKMILLK